jgi:hypothetical protein
LSQLDQWRLLESLFWKEMCLCEQFIAEFHHLFGFF